MYMYMNYTSFSCLRVPLCSRVLPVTRCYERIRRMLPLQSCKQRCAR